MNTHRSCNFPTERGTCLAHPWFTYVDHCQEDGEKWPCEVVRLRKRIAELSPPDRANPFGG